MKKLVLALGALSVFAAAQAFAELAISDADGNGTYSFEELQAAVPDLTEDAFAEADADGNGEIDADELIAAREAGLIPS